jgi:hypothetical protein
MKSQLSKLSVVIFGLCVLSLLPGCKRNYIDGVVQRAYFQQNYYVLEMGNQPSSPFIVIDRFVILNSEVILGMSQQRGIGPFLAITTAADRYVGKNLRVHGEVQVNQEGRRYIFVDDILQIEIR